MKKKIFISQEGSEIRVAVTERGLLEEFYIERKDSLKICGNIYKGIVKAIVPAIGAAFVTLEGVRDGFLYMDEEPLFDIDDINPAFFSFFSWKNSNNQKNDILVEGQEVIVQVVKEPIRNKGPRLTRRISIPGRYIVLIPGREELGVSRRIESKSERNRIKEIFSSVKLPAGVGFIVRTAGEGKSEKEYLRDIKYLLHKWKQIQSKIRRAAPPALVYEETDLVERVIRDNVTENTAEIVVDRKELEKSVNKFLKLYMPNVSIKVKFDKDKKPLFERYGIEREVERAFRRKVRLRCGGHIVIEQTEGLVAIDVNSGSFTSDSNTEETAYHTNMEAAVEIARQIRLRDMGGIIIIDFIDMDKAFHRRDVYRALEEAVRRDKAKTKILQISKLGLVEMTRQRMRPSLESAIYDRCPYCEGRGVVKSAITMSLKVVREIKKSLNAKKIKHIKVYVNPAVAERLVNQEKNVLKEIEKNYRTKLEIIGDSDMHMEDIEISF